MLNNKLKRHQDRLNMDVYEIIDTIAYAIEEKETIIAGITAKRTDQTLHIERLAVDEEHARKGLGTALINKIISYAKHNNIHKITLTTLNFQGKEFYEKHGFEVFATLEDVPKKGYRKYYMILDLKEEVNT